jgi:hypothetical protein
VGDRNHRKGQLRVLGSPSALRTKEPRIGGAPGGRGVRGPDFFCAKAPSYTSNGGNTKTGLRAPRANRQSVTATAGAQQHGTAYNALAKAKAQGPAASRGHI